MRHGSLFSGIGGFDLAAQWMGWQNIFQVEKDPFCRAVLTKNFPNSNRYDDIKTFDGTKYRGTVDIVTGGFPCQPFSTAGKRKGTDDDRYLWPEMLRVIREIQPSYVVGENVRGITNWDEGVVFDSVQSDLEAEGYEVLPFLLPACALNAPHRRDRVWFIAYSNAQQHTHREYTTNRRETSEGKIKGYKWERIRAITERVSTERTSSNSKNIGYERSNRSNGEQFGVILSEGNQSRCKPTRYNKVAPNTNGNQRCERWVYSSESEKTERYTCTCYTCNGGYWKDFPTQPGICRRDDGIPDRIHRIKALGNAIVPQVAFEIFKAIESIA